jgi:50S ribosomal protein L16 3-hydroxylase
MSEAPSIEVSGSPTAPLGMSPEEFLRDYWQKHPLLVRQAFAGFNGPLSPDDLAGLACEPMALSRLVVFERSSEAWDVRNGPFEESEFESLPERDWTLLVQDCDKLIGEVEELLAPFRFVPDWRIDDVMVSYAVPGGSVGAHVDQYDVFLLQGVGTRRWQISTDPDASRDFRADAALKILSTFAPTHDWVLHPGDMLYLPPRVPHHGVAQEACMTWSIGMRAPAVGELLVDFAEQLAERLGDDVRYTDPDLRIPTDSAEIDAAAIARVRALLQGTQDLDDANLQAMFARFITRYRSAQQPAPPPDRIDAPRLAAALAGGAVLYRSPWSRYAWQREGRDARVWFAGEAFAATLRIARILQDRRQLDAAVLGKPSAAELALLTELHNAGHLVIDDA